VILFNEDLRGYYIHGKSPSGSADVSSEKLRMNLHSEAKGNAMIRGIAPTLPESQTFEIYMPKKMIDDYRRNYLNRVV
jgi:hypothetical protein